MLHIYETYMAARNGFRDFIPTVGIHSTGNVTTSFTDLSVTVGDEQCCVRHIFMTDDREKLMGLNIDYVYFDESGSFDGKVINYIVHRMMRSV